MAHSADPSVVGGPPAPHVVAAPAVAHASAHPKAVRLDEYRSPAYAVPRVTLNLELSAECTTVTSSLDVRRAPGESADTPLVLNGVGLELIRLTVDGRQLAAGEYEVKGDQLLIYNLPDACCVRITSVCHPAANKSGFGLYSSGQTLVTHMEPEGFRCLTFFPDRPDVLSSYDVTLVADKAAYPVLLSNGNLSASGELPNGKHFARFSDPLPKPSYLFALVAGKLDKIEREFTTRSGRKVAIEVYTPPNSAEDGSLAAGVVADFLRWDEQTFGFEYDLDRYVIVAVDHLDSGAMENRSLNLFRTSAIIANPALASDDTLFQIQRIVAHEVAHHQTGNTAIPRDWFQLALKEGLTIFRDQEYSASRYGEAFVRLLALRFIREFQFAEDAGANAHSVQPAEYFKIENFYTRTIYNKGAEVFRMMQTLIGRDEFRQIVREFVTKYRGQGTTIEDFVALAEEKSGSDLRQFRLWFTQAGTPILHVEKRYDAATKTLELEISQRTRPAPGLEPGKPLHIPIAVGLLGPDGKDIPLRLEGELTSSAPTTRVLELRGEKQTFRFVGVESDAVPSLLRNFSAPAIVEYPYRPEEAALLATCDSDAVNRCYPLHGMAQSAIIDAAEALKRGEEPRINQVLLDAFGAIIADPNIDPALKADALRLPHFVAFVDSVAQPDFGALAQARVMLYEAISKRHFAALRELYDRVSEAPSGQGFSLAPEEVGRRKLKGTCLTALVFGPDEVGAELALTQLRDARHMTDAETALRALAYCSGPQREAAFATFYDRWKGNADVLINWMFLRVLSSGADGLREIERIESLPTVDATNPKHSRTLSDALALNFPLFHSPDGSGYAFMADRVIALDKLSPKVAASAAKHFGRGLDLDVQRRRLMGAQLERILAEPGLSTNVREVVQSALVAHSRVTA